MFDGNVDIPEYKMYDVDGETLPKIRVFQEALGIKWIRSVLSALHLYLYFSGHTWSKTYLVKFILVKTKISKTDWDESQN